VKKKVNKFKPENSWNNNTAIYWTLEVFFRLDVVFEKYNGLTVTALIERMREIHK
jgi:hypothetical protein